MKEMKKRERYGNGKKKERKKEDFGKFNLETSLISGKLEYLTNK